MKIMLLENTFAVCRLSPTESIPNWINKNSFWTVSQTLDELSIVCRDDLTPIDIKSERGFRILKIEGPLDFNLTGILCSVIKPLADHKISIFTISTFDTDYILIKENDLESATNILSGYGFFIIK